MVKVVNKTDNAKRQQERICFLENQARMAFPTNLVRNQGEIITVSERLSEHSHPVVTIHPIKALIQVTDREYFDGTRKLAEVYEKRFGLDAGLVIETDYS